MCVPCMYTFWQHGHWRVVFSSSRQLLWMTWDTYKLLQVQEKACMAQVYPRVCQRGWCRIYTAGCSRTNCKGFLVQKSCKEKVPSIWDWFKHGLVQIMLQPASDKITEFLRRTQLYRKKVCTCKKENIFWLPVLEEKCTPNMTLLQLNCNAVVQEWIMLETKLEGSNRKSCCAVCTILAPLLHARVIPAKRKVSWTLLFPGWKLYARAGEISGNQRKQVEGRDLGSSLEICIVRCQQAGNQMHQRQQAHTCTGACCLANARCE